MHLHGKSAIVTGAGGGVGMATARALAAGGASVVCVDVDAEGALRASAAVHAAGAAAVPVVVDIASEAGCAEMVEAAMELCGRLDILHNNAALTDPATVALDRGLCETTIEVFHRVMNVNLRGPYLGCRAAIPRMTATGGGVIVNTSSVYSMIGDDVLAAYSISKGGLNALTRHVATAYGREGIRCNSIVLGVVNTPTMNRAKDSPRVRGYVEATLTGRPVEPAEIGAAVAFLASDAAVSITGQIIPIDGGQTVHTPWWRPGADQS
jgi:NAD(P)-dependent dehydrogenase (short-subunit alcohol dehydrogenase family)